MRIVHVNTYHGGGGAARSASRLHEGLAALGHESWMFVKHAFDAAPRVKVFEPPQDLWSRVQRRLRRERISGEFARYQASRPSGYETFQNSRAPNGAELFAQLPRCDVLNLHWIADSFVDYERFFGSVPATLPMVWTLHDMNAFTGGCHYDSGCGGYVKCCGACPQLGSVDRKDLSHQVWARKSAAFRHLAPGRMHIVTPSRWLASEAEHSTLGRRFSVSVIPYGLDLRKFSPRNRDTARDTLGVPQDAKVILFIADGMDNQRKGFPLLRDSLAHVKSLSKVMLVSLGRNKPQINVDVPWVHVDFVSNDIFLSLVYSAADVLVIPSLQDNLPNTVLESMACGTPAVGFSVGGIPEMVRQGITGMVVPSRDTWALGRALVDLLGRPEEMGAMRSNCRRIAMEEYSLERQARRYSALYEAMYERTKREAANGSASHSGVAHERRGLAAL